MARCRYRTQCVEKKDKKAAKTESGDRSQTEDSEAPGHFGTVAENVPEVKRAGSEKRELPAKVAVPELCLFSAEAAQQLVNREERKDTESIIRLVSNVSIDAG